MTPSERESKRQVVVLFDGIITDVEGLSAVVGDFSCSISRAGSTSPSGRIRDLDEVTFVVPWIGEAAGMIEALDGYVTFKAPREIQFHVVYAYVSQCNLEFSRQELRDVLRVGAFLTVSCYDAE